MGDDQIQRHDDPAANDYWQELLMGEDRVQNMMSRAFRAMPSPPRCKICQAPFHGPVAPVLKLLGFRRWALNQQLCKFCISGLAKQKGGAEVSVSLLFADVRGSTSLAETMSPAEFTGSLNRFFGIAAKAVDSEFGVVDHIVGDGVMAMWVPVFVGSEHPRHAVAAGRALASALAVDLELGDSFPAGVGVHTGTAWVGVVGEEGSLDFTVLGDTPNTAARLGSAANGGELVLSDEIVAAVGIDTSNLERRHFELKGKAEPFDAWIERVPA